MGNFKEYGEYDATSLAKLVADGELSTLDVLDEAIDRIETFNPTLNAVVATCFDQVRDAARRKQPSGPLAGVPFLVKDLNTFLSGLPATNGCQAFRSRVPTTDSVLIKRYKSSGLQILGKTNTPELGLNISTEPALFGVTPNPFDPSRSAGGSSGGSAAAVACGMVPLAHATDSGGSIRIPASNCGLYGLKPSRIRVPLGHGDAEGLAGFSVGHAVTVSVRDSALLLNVSAGPVAGDPYSVGEVERPFHAKTDIPDGLRAAVWTTGFADEYVSDVCKNAVRRTIPKLQELGIHAEEARPEIDAVGLRFAFDVLFSSNINALVNQVGHSRDHFEPLTLACSNHGERYKAADYVAAVALLHRTARQLGSFFSRYDLFVTPTLANEPLPLGEISMQHDDWGCYLNRLLDEIPFTPLFNATGCPAVSIPLETGPTGLPVGIHIGAAFGREQLLLSVSAALEAQWPWHKRR